MKSQNPLLKVAPLFLVLFIDSMGLGLLFPILNAIVVDPHTKFLAATTSAQARAWYFGMIVSVFMICWFFGSAILGDLSDSVGRKKALVICLFGAFLGYLLSGIAFYYESLTLLLFGRVIAGFTAGSQPIAQAAIVDVSPEEHKARNIGLILLAVSLGFVFGPIFGGILSDPRWVSWFNYATPLYFAALLAFINTVLLMVMFKETFVNTRKVKIRFDYAIHIFISAFTRKSIRRLSIVLLVNMFGWSNYYSYISMFMLKEYHYSTGQIALFMAVMGIGFSIGCGYLVDYCAQRYQEKRTVIVGYSLAALAAFVTAMVPRPIFVWAASLLIGIAMGTAYSTIIVIFSEQVGEDEQGWVMGVTGAIMALCFGLTTLMSGMVAGYDVTLVIWASFFGLIASAALLYLFDV